MELWEYAQIYFIELNSVDSLDNLLVEINVHFCFKSTGIWDQLARGPRVVCGKIFETGLADVIPRYL